MIALTKLGAMNVGDSFTGEPLIKGLPGQEAVTYTCLSVDDVSSVEYVVMLGVSVYGVFVTKVQVHVEGQDALYTEVVQCL